MKDLTKDMMLLLEIAKKTKAIIVKVEPTLRTKMEKLLIDMMGTMADTDIIIARKYIGAVGN